METRRIYISDSKQGEPIPTNDWWTNLLVDTYSGVLWSYPQVVKADGGGILWRIQTIGAAMAVK